MAADLIPDTDPLIARAIRYAVNAEELRIQAIREPHHAFALHLAAEGQSETSRMVLARFARLYARIPRDPHDRDR